MTFEEWYLLNNYDSLCYQATRHAWNAAIGACKEQLNKDTYYDSEGSKIYPSVDLYGLAAT